MRSASPEINGRFSILVASVLTAVSVAVVDAVTPVVEFAASIDVEDIVVRCVVCSAMAVVCSVVKDTDVILFPVISTVSVQETIDSFDAKTPEDAMLTAVIVAVFAAPAEDNVVVLVVFSVSVVVSLDVVTGFSVFVAPAEDKVLVIVVFCVSVVV